MFSNYSTLIRWFAIAPAIVYGQALAQTEPTMFHESKGVIKFEERSRRKWDTALVADLDQDGRLDLVLTDHSYRANIFWNEGGTFSKPVAVIKGDSHGVAAGDFDQDGRMDLVFSLGGGGGKKPRNPTAYEINRDRTIEDGEKFDDFGRTRGRAAKLVDCDNNGTLDLVLSAFPLKSQTKGANHIYRNAGSRQFALVSHLPFAKWMGFRTLVTDFNNDQVQDLLFYGGKDMVAVQGKEGLAFADASNSVLGDLVNTQLVSCIAEIDYDNDGDFDLFLTRANHPFQRETFYDAENRRFAFFARNETFQFEDLTIEGDLKYENLQMAFPHFDVFVGSDKRKLEFNVDRHGHKDFTLRANESQGWPDELTDKGLYIGHLGDGVWRIAGDTKSPTTGVVHNVTSEPQTTPQLKLPSLLLENREGTYVDVTSRLGISINEPATGVAVGDFDNNGWPDLFVVRYGNPAMKNEQILYLNQDGTWFERATDAGIVSNEIGATGSGAEAFDYDEDGDLDLIYANERGRWHLFTNNGLSYDQHHYVVVKVGSSPTGKATSQGAVLTLEAAGRIYRRVVGATSASFSHSANNHLHVGLGLIDKVDRATVHWTNRESLSLQIDDVNRAYVAGQLAP